MRNIVILNSLHFSYPLPILMRVSYNTLIVKQNTSDYYKYKQIHWYLEVMRVFFMEGSGGVFRQCPGGISTALFPIIVSTLSKKR